ncbi:phosphotransferase enzyme family protein [Seiridium cupressi]
MPTININQEGYERRLLAIQSILDSHGLQPATASAFAKGTQRPGTSPPPQSGVSTVIIRLSNPQAGDLNNANRVENEVAAQLLFRRILSDSHPGLTGANLDEQFMELELPEKLDVVEQIADIFAAFQKTPLPPHLEDHLGGLTLDRNDQIVGGRCRSYLQVHGKNMIHGDLTMNNMLFDKDSKRLNALLDFDFASINHPVHESFTGLWHQGGGLRSGDDEKLHAAILSGNFAWNSALAIRGIIRPSSIQGIEKLEKLNDLEQALCPFQLSNEVKIERLKSKSPEKLEETVKEAGKRLVDPLEELSL